MDGISDGYLVICSYAIALLDLVSALLFGSVSCMLYTQHVSSLALGYAPSQIIIRCYLKNHWTSLAALIFSCLWIGIILMLLMGIYQRRLSYVRYWLVFTCLGIMLDALLLLYGLTLAVSINWEGVKITIMPFIGLGKSAGKANRKYWVYASPAAVEMTFVYIIYIFYLDMICRDEWIPVTKYRCAGGYSQTDVKTELSSSDTLRKERKRLKKMYKREKKAALRELERKLLRGGQV
ncbi:hypothetical protein KR222_001220 [Zaprionus bogoriensis]|nr:hypothetical protein KR222_001220 [Zaprionus bogoriensis]